MCVCFRVHLVCVFGICLWMCVPTWQVVGDGWVSGGVRESLDDCLQECAESMGLVCAGRGASVHQCSPPAAIRDAAVIWALVESHRRGGDALDPEELLVKSPCDGTMEQGSREAAGSEARASLWEDQPRGTRRYNGVGSRRCSAAEREVRCMCKADVVAEMERGGNRVRAVGFDQSWSRVGEAGSAGIRLDMRCMSRILSVETSGAFSAGGGRVRCDPGCTLRELTSALAARGLSLASLPILADQTVGGAVGTGSHGSSLRHGTVSDLVLQQVTVLPGGRELVLQGDDDLAKAARLSMGMLGTCVEIELEVTSSYDVERDIRVVGLGELVAGTMEGGFVREADHAWCFVRMGGDTAVAVLLHRCDDCVCDSDGESSMPEEMSGKGGDGGGGGGGASKQTTHGRGKEGGEAGGHEGQGRGKGRGKPQRYNGQNWFPHPLPSMPDGGAEQGGGEGAWLSMQYSLPLSLMQDGLDVIWKLGKDGTTGMRGRVVELKFLAASSRTLMGPNTRRSVEAEGGKGSRDSSVGQGGCDVVCFNLWWREDTASKLVSGGIRGMMDIFQSEMQALKAVPHWGKMHSLPPGYQAVLAGSKAFNRQVSSISSA